VLAALDMTLAFYFQGERKDNEKLYRFEKKVMSLIYAKKSDEIGFALRVFLHATTACGTEILMCEGH
jgi:hypothetical protein